MEPVEINAGRFYLRALRHDERVDDVPALRALAAHGGDFGTGDSRTDDDLDGAAAIARRDSDWADGTELTWASCLQTDVALLAEIRCVVDGTGARVSARALPGDPDAEEAARQGVDAVARFAAGALGLTVTRV